MDNEDEIIYLDGEGADGILISPVCNHCKHFSLDESAPARSCTAFPFKIPDEIWIGDNSHTEPFPDDGGIRFEKFVND